MHHEPLERRAEALPACRVRPRTHLVALDVEGGVPLFGRALEREVALDDAGRMVACWWDRLPLEYPGLALDTFVVLPAGLRGLVVLDAAPRVPALAAVLGWFKARTAEAYALGVERDGWRPHPGALWARDDQVVAVRDADELKRIRVYLLASPARWNRTVPL